MNYYNYQIAVVWSKTLNCNEKLNYCKYLRGQKHFYYNVYGGCHKFALVFLGRTWDTHSTLFSQWTQQRSWRTKNNGDGDFKKGRGYGKSCCKLKLSYFWIKA